MGAVRSRNVTETVTTMAVPLVADLLRAWSVDSAEFLPLLLHLTLINLSIIVKFVKKINRNGPYE